MFSYNIHFDNFFVFAFLLIASSCVTQKQTKYILDNENISSSQQSYSTTITPNKIQPYDELYIKVLSMEPQTSDFFNIESGSNIQASNLNLITYTVNDSGYIDFPYLGKVKVHNKTVEETKEILKTKLEIYLVKPEVIVKNIERSITILGEVNRPGRYGISREQINVFELIGYAGDLTNFGNRKKVTIIREINKEVKYYYINLSDKSIVSSKLYYLRPNDIVYVEPLKGKFWGFTSVPYGTILSTITTLTTLLYFISAVK